MKRAIVVVLAGALAVAFFACALTGGASRSGRCWESTTIVRVEGPDDVVVANVSLGYMRWGTAPAEGNSGALLVRDGDLLSVELQGKDGGKREEFIVPWRPEDGAKLSFKMDGPRLILGHKTVSLNIGSEDGIWDWLANASKEDLAALRFVLVNESVPDSRYGLLEKLAQVNPHVGLRVTGSPVLAHVPSFDPRWLLVDENKGSQADLDLLVNRKAIETLILNLEDADLNLQGLAALPNLRRLTLVKYDPAKIAMPALPRLESLTFFDGKLQDLTALKALAGLRELNLTLEETISLNGIQALPQLQELGICGAKDKDSLDCAPLDGLKRLRWVSFGPGITPGQFARVIQTHPDLQVVELLNCEDIKNLAPLANLHELKALIFLAKGSEGSIETLKQMKQLRLLVLPEGVFKGKPADAAELRGALPDCVIVEGKPICLGAGRILLLVPLVALGWMVAARRRSRAA